MGKTVSLFAVYPSMVLYTISIGTFTALKFLYLTHNVPFSGQIIPGIVLQSDQLSAAVDNARQLLQLPRSSSLNEGNRTGDMECRSPVQQGHCRSSSRRFRRASERLLSLFASSGGVVVTGRPSGRRKNAKDKGRLSLGAELRGPWSKVESSKKIFSQR